MAFDITDLTQASLGGAQGQKIFMYFTSDAQSNGLAAGTLDATLFDGLYDYCPQAASGDIIISVNGVTPAVTIFAIYANDENGTSVIPISGII